MNDKELNLLACIGAFADENGQIPFDIDSLDVVNRNEDCLRLLTAEEKIVDDDVLKAARRAASRVAADWVTDADVARYRKFQSAISR